MCCSSLRYPSLGVVHYGLDSALVLHSFVRKFTQHTERIGLDIKIQQNISCKDMGLIRG